MVEVLACLMGCGRGRGWGAWDGGGGCVARLMCLEQPKCHELFWTIKVDTYKHISC